MTADKQYRIAEALLRLSHENSNEHEMKSAWLKFWALCGEVDIFGLNKKAQTAYHEGVRKWGTPTGKDRARANDPQRAKQEAPPKKPYAQWQEAQNRRAEWGYQQAYRSDPTPRGFTMRRDEQEQSRTYHTQYTHNQFGTRAERIMEDQHMHIWCHECGEEAWVTHYPGNTGKYCSPACKHKATNRQAAARMKAKRLRDSGKA